MPIDPRRYLLPEHESQRIFHDEIAPEELAHGVPQDQPVVVFVAGQPGAGKTMTTLSVKRELDRRGGAIVVNSDFYKPYHPEYSRLLREDDRNAAPYTSMDGRRWMAAAEHYLIERRVDTIIETTMRDPGDFLEPAAMFRAAGYRAEAAIMAVPEPLSRLGIVHRYHDQVRDLGHGRLTARDNHDASYRGVLQAAEAIDRDRVVDVATVYRRGNHQLHMNYLDAAGTWRWPAGAASAIDAERQRPWNPDETKAFADTVRLLADQMGREWHSEFQDIVRLAAPLADPYTPLPDITHVASGITAAARAFPTSTRQSLPLQPAERTAVAPPPRASQEESRGEEAGR
ncbi:zeta toxin family protein [Micromonospora maris]|uniref:zeta toxin family protein n=1 Tax=Micromonospora maris TaxID=1003110 RepID=UPI000206B4C6|nr:zeta toxin family protein [Micromonospora maris]AEB48034.1 zeta toxin family protein [Micromonospora maris AB-18-032]